MEFLETVLKLIKHVLFRTKNQLYEKARQTEEAPRSIISHVTATVSLETAAALPKYKNLVRQKERKRVVQEHNPKTLAAIVIPAELHQTLRATISWLMTQGPLMRNGFSFSQQKKTLIYWRLAHIGMPMERLSVALNYFIKFSPFTAF